MQEDWESVTTGAGGSGCCGSIHFLQLTIGFCCPQKDASPACEGEKEKELRHRIHHHGIMVFFFPAVMLLMVQRSHSQPPFGWC